MNNINNPAFPVSPNNNLDGQGFTKLEFTSLAILCSLISKYGFYKDTTIDMSIDLATTLLTKVQPTQ